jgi:hypothetical protein
VQVLNAVHAPPFKVIWSSEGVHSATLGNLECFLGLRQEVRCCFDFADADKVADLKCNSIHVNVYAERQNRIIEKNVGEPL